MNKVIRTSIQFIIPQDKDMHEALKRVDDGCRHEAESRDIITSMNSWTATTIAIVYMQNAVNLLNLKMKGVTTESVDLFKLIEIVAKNRKNTDAEKEGNINASFHPGKTIVKLSEEAEDLNDLVNKILDNFEFVDFLAKPIDDLTNEEYESRRFIEAVDKATKRELFSKNGLTVPSDWSSSIVTYLYLKHIYIELIKDIIANGSASINFFDITEFHGVLKNDVLGIVFNPGHDSKKLIKSDEITEEYDGLLK